MDTKSLDVLWSLGFVGVVSFGLTYFVSVAYYKYTKNKKGEGKQLTTLQKGLVQGVFAFVLLFVPLETQNVFMENLKVAVGVVASSATLWNVVKAL